MSVGNPNPVVPTPQTNVPSSNIPSGDHTWNYSLWDLLDETLWGCVFLGVWLFLFFWGGNHEALVCLYGGYISLGFGLIFWLWTILRKMSQRPDKKSALGLFLWAILLTSVGAALWGIAFFSPELKADKKVAAAGTTEKAESEPAKADTPAKVDTPAKADTSAKPDTPAKTDAPAKPAVYYGSKAVLYGYGTIVLFYWFWLIYQIFVRKMFVSYTLTPRQFVHKHGFLVAREERYEIWDVEQVNMTANLWQRIVGVGEVELVIKDQKYDQNGVKIVTGTASSSTRRLVLYGLRHPGNVQSLINQYRMFVRTQVLNAVVSA